MTKAVLLTSILGHLLVVTIYAAALSSVGTSSSSSVGIMTIMAALTIQICSAPGRLAGGYFSDRRSPVLVLALAIGLISLGAFGFIAAPSHLWMIAATTLIGFASGVGQTAALTGMMRRARATRSTEMISAGWNITFDVGLGIGAVIAGVISL